jgi:hypothetical protein
VFIRHEVGVPGLRKSLLFVLVLVSLTWVSCGGGGSSAPATHTSGVPYRAFLTNNVSAGSAAAGVYIVNAATDVRAPAGAISAGNNPGMMVLTPNRAQTLVFSGNGTQTSDNQFSIINNGTEATAGHMTLPGMTESFVVAPDSSAAYVAVPTAPVVGEAPGVVEAISLSTGTVAGQVNVPDIHYLSIDNGGNRILGFSDNSDSVAVITPSNIGISNPLAYIGGTGIFDRPVQAFFSSDDTTAYVVSCGAECGGTQASVQEFNLITNTLVASVPSCVAVPSTNPVQCAGPAAGSFAMLNGSTMLLAGTPPAVGGVPQQPCTGEATAATSCGLLTIVDLPTMSVTNTTPIIITDGYHNRMGLGPNGQLFIGARTCTEIIPPVPPPTGAETRGCLSIYNMLASAVGNAPAGGVLIPPVNGDVTGIQPIGKRGENVAQEVVYVVQGGSLLIYDTTIDALEYNPNNSNNPGEVFGLVGQFFDVKTVDF